MRITKLAFENLNSLQGAWTIDFTHPDYARNHDIFVIHGPTGAGKTTILDAITLALYGRTPRLEAINNGEGGNELMTRGTGFCRAAVTYRCKSGVFVSEFQQNRAGGKASGRLQKASFKITRENGEVVASGTGSLLERETQRLTQLDYKQFCRSIMLAQGEFSTFLKSAERERAEILEKLTGTERYREIGKHITARFSELKRAFTAKKAEKESIERLLLSAEALAAAEQAEATYTAQLAAATEELSALQKELTFYDELERLEQALHTAEATAARSEQALAAFAPQAARLLQAQAAKNCESAYATAQGQRRAQKADNDQLTTLATSIATAQSVCEQAAARAAAAKAQLTAEQADITAQQVVWKRVRELDVQLAAAGEKRAEAQQRKLQAEAAVTGSEAKIAQLTAELTALENSLADVTRYLAQNQHDEALPQVLARLETLQAALSDSQQKAKASAAQRATLTAQRDELQQRLTAAQEALTALDAEITAFISSDAVFIAQLLRRELVAGKPCPVCGSPYHKSHGAAVQGELDLFGANDTEASAPPADDAAFATEKAQAVVLQSSNLQNRRDEITAELQTLEAQLQSAASDLKYAESNLAAAEDACSQQLAQINAALSPWQLTATPQSLTDMVATLRARSASWTQKAAAQKKYDAEKAEKAAAVSTVQDTLTELRDALTVAAQSFTSTQAAEQQLLAERHSLFGEKSVDAEEATRARSLEQLRTTAERAERTQQQAKEEAARLEAQQEQLQAAVDERAPVLASSEAALSRALQANGFAAEDAFTAARMSDSAFAALSRQSELLKTQQTQAQTSLTNAQRSYSDYKATAQVARSRAELQAAQAACSRARDALQKQLIAVKTQLATNAQQQTRAEQVRKDYDALQQDYATWEQLKKWVGRDDGADLSVFVQSLAFNSLLTLTNKKLFGITARYKLAQKASGSLDFEIIDSYFAEPRSIANLSGGEQFLVSLSLALGISEFASRNVRVDSLFLDEGFGTLSGELLTEAINALKNLQKDNKMLGIITHVQSVINEIDQRIAVKPVSGGHSVLIGAGITQEA